MNCQNLLDPVWTSYETTLDCLKIADRSVKQGAERLLKGTRFIEGSLSASTMIIFARCREIIERNQIHR